MRRWLGVSLLFLTACTPAATTLLDLSDRALSRVEGAERVRQECEQRGGALVPSGQWPGVRCLDPVF